MKKYIGTKIVAAEPQVTTWNFIGRLVVNCITKKPITTQRDPGIPQLFDTFLRLSNECVKPLPILTGGHHKTNDIDDPERIIKENDILRTELNRALQKLDKLKN